MYHNLSDIRGKHFTQESLQLDLQNRIAGQSYTVFLILILIVFLLNIVAGFLGGFVGALTGLQIFFSTDAQLHYILNIIVIFIILTSAISQNLTNIIFTVITSIFTLLISSFLLNNLGFLVVESEFFITAPLIIITLLIISLISFFVVRFTIALGEIIFFKLGQIKNIVMSIVILCGAFTGSLAETFLELQNVKFQQVLKLTNVQIKIICIGIIFASLILLFSWLANRFRNVPWNHQSLLSSWALAVGSWGGTSFYNLDLSNVNFRNATLPNTDLRAKKLYRTCFQGSKGLERARVNGRYIDLEIPKVQKLLTKKQGYDADKDFSHLKLRGAFLQDMEMRRFNFTDTDLIGADMRRADLRGSIFVRTKVIDVDFTEADLTGICIEDWSVNSQTRFTNVTCNYVYRKLDDKGEGTDRFPAHRDFEPREFESLYQEVENVIEIIFQEGENWQAALYSLVKLQMDDEKLELKLKGVEKRGDVWVVKVTYNDVYPKQQVEHLLNSTVEEMKLQLAAKEQQIYLLEQEKRDLLGIAKDQAKALEGYSRQRESLSESNNFFISGSTITNLAGSGQIDYGEAATQVRSIVANSNNSGQLTTILQNFLTKVQRQNLASTEEMQADLMQHIILTEAEKDMVLKQFLLQQGEQVVAAFPKGILAIAIRDAIAQLTENS